jgi:hypothetical protein
MERTERPPLNGSLRGPPGETWWVVSDSQGATVSVRDANDAELAAAARFFEQQLTICQSNLSAAINAMIQTGVMSGVVAYERERRQRSIQIITRQ